MLLVQEAHEKPPQEGDSWSPSGLQRVGKGLSRLSWALDFSSITKVLEHRHPATAANGGYTPLLGDEMEDDAADQQSSTDDVDTRPHQQSSGGTTGFTVLSRMIGKVGQLFSPSSRLPDSTTDEPAMDAEPAMDPLPRLPATTESEEGVQSSSCQDGDERSSLDVDEAEAGKVPRQEQSPTENLRTTRALRRHLTARWKGSQASMILNKYTRSVQVALRSVSNKQNTDLYAGDCRPGEQEKSGSRDVSKESAPERRFL